MSAQSIYLYRATQACVLHGHLVEASIELGFGLGFRARIRLAEYAAPEPFETPIEAAASRAALSALLPLGKRFYVRTLRDSSGVYTTVTGRIFLKREDGFLDVVETLRKSGYARGGGQRYGEDPNTPVDISRAVMLGSMQNVVHAVDDPMEIPL